jgi:hypothetical protein
MGAPQCRFTLFIAAHDFVHVLLVDDHATLGASCLGAQLGAEIIDINLAIPEFVHGLQTIPEAEVSILQRNINDIKTYQILLHDSIFDWSSPGTTSSSSFWSIWETRSFLGAGWGATSVKLCDGLPRSGRGKASSK